MKIDVKIEAFVKINHLSESDHLDAYKQNVQKLIEDSIHLGKYLLSCPVGLQYLVWEFYTAPEPFRKLCNLNGGDEDWLILAPKNNDNPSWIDRTDTCSEPDEYHFEDFIIFVGSHA